MPVPEQVGHATAELNDNCSAEKHAGRGALFVMVLLQLWYLIHIFDRNGGDAIVFHGCRQRTRIGGDAVEYGEMDWERKDIYIVYINKFAGEQDRSLFPGVGRLTSEYSEHPHKALMGSSAVSAC